MKKYSCRIFFTAIVAAFMSFAFVACGDDSSSASNDEQPGSSSDETVLSSSSNAGEEKTGEGIECPAESEGMYKTVVDTVALYDSGDAMTQTSYYHCESGMWVKTECRDPLDACTADNEGEMKNVVCTQQPDNPKAAKEEWDFVCKDKKWEKLSAEESRGARINAQCTKDDTKIGDVCGIIKMGVIDVKGALGPVSKSCYIYTEEGWVEKGDGSWHASCEHLAIVQPKCTTDKTDVGDTCSVVVSDTLRHYRFVCFSNVFYTVDGYDSCDWVELDVDPELGSCSFVSYADDSYKKSYYSFVKKGEEYYYCSQGWRQAVLVPRQYTDPRKEGLTDEEFDVLDLPEEASVGDRVGGLLEYCYANYNYLKWQGHYCVPQNHYRYSETGEWVKLTDKELEAENCRNFGCTEDNIGEKCEELPIAGEPGAVYQCGVWKHCYDKESAADNVVAWDEACPEGYKEGTSPFVGMELVKYIFSQTEWE